MEPIALLPELTKSLAKTARGLAPWDALARLEEVLLRRARSAFLVAWFGKGVPVKRLNLSIVIVNIADLRERYSRVMEDRPGPLPKYNLIGPMAGLAGVVAGILLSPLTGAIVGHELSELLAAVSGQEWLYWLSLLPTTLGVWIVQAFGVGVIALVAVPLALVGAFLMANQQNTRAIVELMGEFAMLIDAGLKLWDQITGPREKVRNPLLRAILNLLDPLATLFAQILGAVSLIVVRVLPLVPNLLAQFRAFKDLAKTLIEALMAALSGITDAIKAPFDKGGGIMAILTSVFETLAKIPATLMEHIGNYLSDAATDMGFLFESLSAKITTFLSEVADKIVEAFHKTPLGRLVSLIEGLMKLLPAFAAELMKAIRMPGPPEPPDDGESLRDTLRGTKAGLVLQTPDALADVIDRATELPLPDLPEFSLPPLPKVPTLPDKPALEAKIGRAGPVDFAAEAKRLLKEARAGGVVVQPEAIMKRPASIFGPEMRALKAAGKPAVTPEDTRLRNALYLAVGRVLPGDLRVYAPQLRSFFDEIDKQLYGVKPAEPPELPQQDLDYGGRLQPKVDTLRIRARNALAPDVRAFRDRVVDRMKRQDYFAPVAAAGGG